MKKSYFVIGLSLLVIVAVFVAVKPINTNQAANGNQDELMKKLGYTKELVSDILKKRTSLGQDTSQLESIISMLPEQSYRKFKTYTMTSNQTLDLIYVSSDNYNRGGNGLDTFPESVKENNALLLLSSIKGLSTVNFLYYEDESQTILNKTDTYNMEVLKSRFGVIDPQTIKAQQLYISLSKNLQLSEFYFSHYSRLFLGSKQELVSYRLGEPSQVLKRDDGSVIWQYEETDQKFYFDNKGTLSATSTPECAGQTYEELVAYLGVPSTTKKLASDTQYIAYSLRQDPSHFAYFILKNNIVISSGVTVNDSYSLLSN